MRPGPTTTVVAAPPLAGRNKLRRLCCRAGVPVAELVGVICTTDVVARGEAYSPVCEIPPEQLGSVLITRPY